MASKPSVEDLKEQLDACMRLTAIGELAAGVAHELNNPLSVILGFTQSLMHQSSDQESLRSSLKTIERETLRCRRLVQDLLNFSRLPKSGRVMEDIVQVLEGAIPLVESQARMQNVQIERRFVEPLAMAYIDRHKIQQLIINLSTNALAAMPKGGQLVYHASMTLSSEGKTGLELQVQDTGAGIAADIQDKIFEPFFTTKKSGEGTGLGLSLVQDIVRFHDGQMTFKSELNRGTIFRVWLPARAPAQTASVETTKDPVRGRSDAHSDSAQF